MPSQWNFPTFISIVLLGSIVVICVGDFIMKCGNCDSWAKTIWIEDEKMVLCKRCIQQLKKLNQEYLNIIGNTKNQNNTQKSKKGV